METTDALPPGVFDRGRVEAFSDGVIAVAITLLVLDLRVPEADGAGSLGARLAALWPNYTAYVVSFLAIGIMWLGHHTMLRRLVGVDHSVLVLNLLLLMCFVALPFTTSLLSTYLSKPGGHLAAVVYAGSFLVTSAMFSVTQWHLMKHRPQLLRHTPDPAEVRAILRRSASGPPVYLVAGLLGLVTPYLTLGLCIALGVFYLARPMR